jgi:hypothetical protein
MKEHDLTMDFAALAMGWSICPAHAGGASSVSSASMRTVTPYFFARATTPGAA